MPTGTGAAGRRNLRAAMPQCRAARWYAPLTGAAANIASVGRIAPRPTMGAGPADPHTRNRSSSRNERPHPGPRRTVVAEGVVPDAASLRARARVRDWRGPATQIPRPGPMTMTRFGGGGGKTSTDTPGRRSPLMARRRRDLDPRGVEHGWPFRAACQIDVRLSSRSDRIWIAVVSRSEEEAARVCGPFLVAL
jgi:hypothetical protein